MLQVALGRSEADEHRPGLSQLSSRLRSDTGLVFTNLTRAELDSQLESAQAAHFARAGCVAQESVTLEAGPLVTRGGLAFPHPAEPQLRATGVPCRLRGGVVELLCEHTLCEEGAVLSSGQCTALKLLGLQMATFSMALDSVWGSDGAFEVISEPAAAVAQEAAEAFGDDGGDFTFTEVEVPSDDERAVRARKGGRAGAGPLGRGRSAAAAAE